jgi:hypothetical protein
MGDRIFIFPPILIDFTELIVGISDISLVIKLLANNYIILLIINRFLILSLGAIETASYYHD